MVVPFATFSDESQSGSGHDDGWPDPVFARWSAISLPPYNPAPILFVLGNMFCSLICPITFLHFHEDRSTNNRRDRSDKGNPDAYHGCI